MPIYIFNPPVPHADPTTGGLPGNSPAPYGGQACGNCPCVAHYYQINPVATGAQIDPYPAIFMGQHVLRRDLSKYRIDSQEQCHWDEPLSWPGQFSPTGPEYPGGWSLYCQGAPGSGFNSGWILRAAGQTYVGGAPPQDTAFYTLQAPGFSPSPFDCLRSTTFNLDSNYGSTQSLANFPTSIVVKPFWP